MVVAHIGGIPVEETLLALAPVGVAGAGAMVAGWFQRVRRHRPIRWPHKGP